MIIKNPFEIYYLVGLIIGSIVRKIGTAKRKGEEIVYREQTTIDKVLVALGGLGLLAPLFYLFTPWLRLADYSLPLSLNWLGVIIFPLGIWLLWRSHADLGRNWSVTLEIRKGQTLVTSGVFRYFRHPMYLAHLLWAIAQALLISNWISGPAMLFSLIPLYLYRIPREEKMMLKNFGKEYRSYMKRTGCLFPKIRK